MESIHRERLMSCSPNSISEEFVADREGSVRVFALYSQRSTPVLAYCKICVKTRPQQSRTGVRVRASQYDVSGAMTP